MAGSPGTRCMGPTVCYQVYNIWTVGDCLLHGWLHAIVLMQSEAGMQACCMHGEPSAEQHARPIMLSIQALPSGHMRQASNNPASPQGGPQVSMLPLLVLHWSRLVRSQGRSSSPGRMKMPTGHKYSSLSGFWPPQRSVQKTSLWGTHPGAQHEQLSN